MIKGYIAKWKPEIDRAILSNLKGEVPSLWEKAKDYIQRGGKRLRPALVLIGAREAGGSETDVLELGAAVELFHNFSLVHDDIEDSSDLRRGKPCLHIIHGVPLAINAGDAMLIKSFQMCAKYGKEVSELFAQIMCGVAEGQELDISWSEKGHWPSEKEYMTMVEKKTGVLMGGSLLLGSAACGNRLAGLDKLGRALGIAFQIQDDIMNVAGDVKKMGKDFGSDITEGKRTIMVIKSLEDSNKANRLREILESNTRDKELILEAIDILDSCGAIDYARELASKTVKDAFAKTEFKDPVVEEFMNDLGEFVIKREV